MPVHNTESFPQQCFDLAISTTWKLYSVKFLVRNLRLRWMRTIFTLEWFTPVSFLTPSSTLTEASLLSLQHSLLGLALPNSLLYLQASGSFIYLISANFQCSTLRCLSLTLDCKKTCYACMKEKIHVVVYNSCLLIQNASNLYGQWVRKQPPHSK